jgi:nucleoside-diphosphate-sugar epimerase
MKILVVGGAGYVGGHLVDLLSGLYDVTVYDLLLFEKRFMKKVNFIFGDIRDTKKLGSIINEYDVVVWLAGMVGDGACAVNPALTTAVNYESVKWLVDNYTGKIAFPSTCSIYGINNDLIDEEAEPNPLSLYAATKLKAEQYIRDHATGIT